MSFLKIKTDGINKAIFTMGWVRNGFFNAQEKKIERHEKALIKTTEYSDVNYHISSKQERESERGEQKTQ